MAVLTKNVTTMYVKVNHRKETTFWQVVTVEGKDGSKLPATKKNIEDFLSMANQSGKLLAVSFDCHLETIVFSDECSNQRITTISAVIEGIQTIHGTDTATFENLNDIITSNDIVLFEDAGHGWLKVPLSLIRYLQINPLITGYSYVDGKNAYLEEDCDMSTFLNAIGITNSDECKLLQRGFFNSVPRRYSDRSPVRSYAHYDNVIIGKRFNQSSLGSLDALVHKLALG